MDFCICALHTTTSTRKLFFGMLSIPLYLKLRTAVSYWKDCVKRALILSSALSKVYFSSPKKKVESLLIFFPFYEKNALSFIPHFERALPHSLLEFTLWIVRFFHKLACMHTYNIHMKRMTGQKCNLLKVYTQRENSENFKLDVGSREDDEMREETSCFAYFHKVCCSTHL